MTIISNINVASKATKAKLVLKNAFIINVFTQSIEKNDIAINGDTIVGIGKYDGIEEIDCTGLFVAPGFIDAHVHIESSMVPPSVFSQLVIEKGVTSVIADPHEIANVLGLEGIDFMIKSSLNSVNDIFFMLPSCVPATTFEDNGAILTAKDLNVFIKDKRVLGLGEVMDVPAVLNRDKELLKKLNLAKHKNIDGHCPGVSDMELNAYLCAGISTDHECSTSEEASKKVQRGMYVMLREGSATKNLRALLPAVNKENYQRFLFCTDDKHINDLIQEGTIDNCIRIAISEGIEPVMAFTIASLNAATCYGLRYRGAIAPGYLADLVIFDDINSIKIKKVIKSGKVYQKNTLQNEVICKPSMNCSLVNETDFGVEYKGEFINVIKTIPYSVETLKEKRKAFEKDGYVFKIEGDNILKIGVIERHKDTGKKGIGYIEGLGLINCSIAQTIAHDSHNIIVVGDNDKDMTLAVNTIINIGGGIVIVSQGKVIDYLSLPIGGLMTDEDPAILREKVENLDHLAKNYGVKEGVDPFLTLAFMALPVIPKLKITARGIFDYEKFDFIDLFEK